MSALRKLTLKTPNSLSLLTSSSRFLATRNPNPNPDEPTAANYDNLINIAGRSRDFATVHRLLNKRFKDGCFNTPNTFRFITSIDKDLAVLDELSRTLARLDKGFARKSAYDSLIARLSKLNRIDECLRVVDTMVRGGFGVNVCSYHPILNVLTKKKNMDEAWRVMELMRENGVPPDVTAYNYILKAYCFVGDVKSAAGVLTKMGEEGMEADSRTYDALVLGACRAGKVEGALVVLRRMEDDGVPLRYSTHMHVIGGLLGLGYYEQAVEFVRSYGGKDKGLETESFGSLASRLINLKRFEEAKLVLEEMNERGLVMGHASSSTVAFENKVECTAWLAGESQADENFDLNGLDDSLLCKEILDSYDLNYSGPSHINYNGSTSNTNDVTGDNIITCGFSDLENLELDTPPDFPLSDFQFDSQDSILGWIDRL